MILFDFNIFSQMFTEGIQYWLNLFGWIFSLRVWEKMRRQIHYSFYLLISEKTYFFFICEASVTHKVDLLTWRQRQWNRKQFIRYQGDWSSNFLENNPSPMKKKNIEFPMKYVYLVLLTWNIFCCLSFLKELNFD